MPTILDRYIFREILVPFILAMTAFTSALLMGRFLKISELVVAKGVPLTEITLLIAYLIPSFALFTIPMSFLLAVMLAFGRLSGDSEVIAMKSCGVGISRLLKPVMAFALLATAATALIALFAVPAGNTAFKALLAGSLEKGAGIELRDRVFFDSIPGMVIYVDQFDEQARQMTGIMIQDERKPNDPLTIFANKGSLALNPATRQLRLRLTDGSIHRTKRNDDTYRLAQFREYELAVNLGESQKGFGRNELDMPLDELRQGIGSVATEPKLRRDMELELHRRFATPFACIVFALAGVPLGIQNKRSGRGGSFSVGIVLILLYYIVLSTFKALGERGSIHAAAAMWGPNICFLALGIWLFRHAAAERPLLSLIPFAPLFVRLKNRLTGTRRTK